ncbi:MAG: D-glycerate dehydrogenase [Bacteroidota bacterium]
MKAKVFLTRKLPEEAIAYLQEKVDLEMNPHDRVLSREELAAGIRGKDALLCLLTDQIDAELMDLNPGLQVISNYAVGFNNIDVAAATQRGIPVTNTPGVLTETSADLAFALLISAARRIVEADEFVRKGQWQGWGPMQFLGTDVFGAKLGIVGLGRIGKALARRARGFDMDIYYWNRTRLSLDEEKKLGLQYCTLAALLSQVDYVSLHLAYHPATHHFISVEELAMMKPSAFLINTARGAIVDEAALVSALAQRQIAGAGLDVFEREPQVSPGLFQMKNVVLLPHLGSATHRTRTRMAKMAVDNLLAVLEGKRPDYLVNEVSI